MAAKHVRLLLEWTPMRSARRSRIAAYSTSTPASLEKRHEDVEGVEKDNQHVEEVSTDVNQPVYSHPTLKTLRRTFAAPNQIQKRLAILDQIANQDAQGKAKFIEALSKAKRLPLLLYAVYERRIVACFKARNFKHARGLIRQARTEQLKFEESSWAEIIAQLPTFKDRFEAYICLIADTTSTTFQFNAALSMAWSKHEYLQMVELFREMQMQSVKPDQFTYEIMLTKARRHKEIENALELYQHSKINQIQLSKWSYNELLYTIPAGSQYVDIFNDGIAQGIIPSAQVINVILSSWLTNWKQAALNWNQYFAKDAKVAIPSIESYVTIFKCFHHALMSKQQNHVPLEPLVSTMEEIYQQFLAQSPTMEKKTREKFSDIHLTMQRAYVTTLNPKAIQLMRDQMTVLTTEHQQLALTNALEMAVNTKSRDIVHFVLTTLQKLKFECRDVDNFHLACFYCAIDEFDTAIIYIEKKAATSKQPWYTLRTKLEQTNRVDLVQRFDAVYVI